MLNDLTFVTSLQIESNDRLRNSIAVFSYISKNFPEAKILIKEVDEDSNFLKYAFPEIQKLSDGANNISHTFVKHDGLFNKSKVINELVLECDTDIVFNYDVDVMMPIESYVKAYHMLLNQGYDVVYPYGSGVYQYNVLGFDNHINSFISSGYQLESLIPHSQRLPSVQGWCQMFRKESYCKSFGFNENFIFVGYEDTEFLFRMGLIGNKIGRVSDNIYHLEHVRVHNKNYSDREFYEKNILLWEWIRKQNKETVIEYYNNQDYIKKFK
jgi:predicted glycosyltransferase involved in capsule biosynthesis